MNLRFKQATRIFTKTLPFVWLRIAVGVAFGIFALLYFGFVGLMLHSLGDISSVIFLLLVVATVGIFFGILRLLRKYVLYMVSAGHTAVIAHIVETGHVPEDQVSFGKNKVTNNFAEANGLFVVDKLIKAVLNQFNSAVISVSNLLGFVPAFKNILTIIRKSVVLAGSYLDQAILAHIFLHEEKGRWTAARDGIVLYGKTWKPVLASAMVIVVGGYVAFALLAVVLSPVALAVGQLSSIGQLLGWAVVGGVIVTAHFGFVGPWIQTVIITTFLEESRGKTTDSEAMDFIAGKASKFRELAENAANERGGTPAAGGQQGAGGGVGERSAGRQPPGGHNGGAPQQGTAGGHSQNHPSSQQPANTAHPQHQQGGHGTNPQAGQGHSRGYGEQSPQTDQQTSRQAGQQSNNLAKSPRAAGQPNPQHQSGSQDSHTPQNQPAQNQPRTQQGTEQRPQSDQRSQRSQQGRQHPQQNSQGNQNTGNHGNSNPEYARQTRQNHNPNYGEQDQQNHTPNYQQNQRSHDQHHQQPQRNSEQTARQPQQNRSQTAGEQNQSQPGNGVDQPETEQAQADDSVPEDLDSGSR